MKQSKKVSAKQHGALKRQRKLARHIKRISKRKRKPPPIKSPDTIPAPESFTFLSHQHQENMLLFLHDLRRLAKKRGFLQIDFSAVKEIHPYAMLLVVAEISRLQALIGSENIRKCTAPIDLIACKVFQHIGLCNLLNISSNHVITEEDHTVFNWLFASGQGNYPELAKHVLFAIKEKLPEDFRKVTTGVLQAMDNSSAHAHLLPRGDGIEVKDDKRWWSFVHVTDKSLTVVFCDLGAGIPRTLHATWPELVSHIFSMFRGNKRDLAMLKRSFRPGRSGTKKAYRGKGLGDIRSAVEELKGSLLVISNRAAVLYDYHDANPEGRIVENAYKRSIMGTILQWTIPFGSAEQ